MNKWPVVVSSLVLLLAIGVLIYCMHPKKQLVLDPPPYAKQQVIADEIQKIRTWLLMLPSDDVVKLQEAGRIEYPYESFKAQYPEFDKQLTYYLTHSDALPKDYKFTIKSIGVNKFRGNAYQVQVNFKPSGSTATCAAGYCGVN